MVEALCQRGLCLRQSSAVQLLQWRQFRGGLLVGFQHARKALGLRSVLAVPDDQGARLLKEHRLGQRRNQLLPARQRVVAHAHHARLGDGGFGQRCQHGGGHRGGRLFCLGAACVVNLNPVALACQLYGEQAAHEAGAQNCEG